jgi:mycothiol system anti-sigma-R factor
MTSSAEQHEGDCAGVLAHIYEYIDHEMADQDCETVKQHLEECSPCLAEFGLDQVVKSLVQRSCGCELAPADLRSKVLSRIRQVQDELSHDTEGLTAAD